MIYPMKTTHAVVLAAGALFCGVGQASEALARKGGCLACHAADKKILGPSYKDVAARYKGQAGAPALLAERVRKGSQGVWGVVPMPPTEASRLSDAELKTLTAWVLKGGG
jgi:cytochrome c